MDLHDRTVLRGVTDAHTHLINLGERLVRLNLKDIPTEKEVIEDVKQRAASAASGAPRDSRDGCAENLR